MNLISSFKQFHKLSLIIILLKLEKLSPHNRGDKLNIFIV